MSAYGLPVTIRFHRGTGWGSRLVRWWTNSDIGHVDLIHGNQVLDVRPSVGVCMSAEADVPDMRIVDTITLWLDPAHVVDADLALATWVGSRYDWWGAIAAGMPWFARQHKDRGFCSEMVGDWLNAAGQMHFPETWRLQPVTIRNLLRNGTTDG